MEKLEKKKLGNPIKRAITRWNRNFSKTGTGFSIMALFVSAILMMGILKWYFPPVLWFVCFLVGFCIMFVSMMILYGVTRLLFQNKKKTVILWFLLFFLLFLCIMLADHAGNVGGDALFSLLTTMALSLSSRSIWAFFVNRKHNTLTMVCGVVSTGVLICEVILLSGQGFPDTYIAEYEKKAETISNPTGSIQESVANDTLESFKRAVGEGTYQVKTISYGPGDSDQIKAGTYDLTPFSERSSIAGIAMKAYFGYELSKAPIAGQIWYPEDAKNVPVLFIVHGNSDYTRASYMGYAYLGEFLASHGYVVVSVDENCCNDLNEENDARAVMMLENIKQVLAYNEDSSTPFYQMIDEEQIALAGHSRGGESVATAYLFNMYDNYPENGTIHFDYHFNIQSIIAIAPTVDMYMPAEHEVSIEDVNYLVIHGSNDHDVNQVMGMKQYQNVAFSKKGKQEGNRYIKSVLYIAGANHGQFNSEWGTYDLPFPFNTVLNVESLIESKEQKEILKIFTKIFLDVTLRNDSTHQRLFTDVEDYLEELPETIYQQSYQTSDFMVISDSEEDSNLSTGTMPEVTIDTRNMTNWKEERDAYGNGGTKENYVTALEWNDTDEASIRYQLPSMNMQEKIVQFDVSNQKEDVFIDGIVVLKDAEGNQVSARIGDFMTLYPALPVQLTKLDHLFGYHEYKHQFQTISIPIETMKYEESEFDITQVVGMDIIFDSMDNGTLLLDNVGIR